MVALGFLLLYIAISKRGALVADFFVKLFQAPPTKPTEGSADE